MERAIVFDAGGTYLRSGALLAGGELRQYGKRRLKNHLGGCAPGEIWSDLSAAILGILKERAPHAPRSLPLVIAFPGPVTRTGRVLSAPSLTGQAGCPYELGAELGRLTGHPVHLLNDMSAATWYLGTRSPSGRFLAVTVSSGIGSKIYDQSRSPAVLDDVPHAGEIGHLVVDDAADAPLCDCGARGHLGAIASGRGIERAARRAAREDPEGFRGSLCARDFGATPERLTNEEHLVPAAARGDAWALAVVRGCTAPLARTICAVLLGAGLDEVAVIGGFAQSLGQPYVRILGEELAKVATYELLRERAVGRIRLAEAGEETCLLGAAAYAGRLAGAGA